MLKLHHSLQRFLNVVPSLCKNNSSHQRIFQTTSVWNKAFSLSKYQNMATKIHSKSYSDTANPVMAYILENSLREPEFLLKLREETMKLPNCGMLADPVEAQFLRLLVGAAGAKRYGYFSLDKSRQKSRSLLLVQ